MKWKNKGHELDRTGEYLKHTKKIWMYGACDGAMITVDFLTKAAEKFNSGVLDFELCFVDRDEAKQGNYKGYHCVSPEEFRKNISVLNHDVVVLSMNDQNIEQVSKEISYLNLERKFNLFSGYEMSRYASVFFQYRYHRLFISAVDFFYHTYCNLNCIGCASYAGTRVNKRITENEFQRNVDLIFKKVDYAYDVYFGCGDSFLFKEPKWLDYVFDHYGESYGRIHLITNGTIMPKQEIIDSAKRNKVFITVDDYTDSLPEYSDSLNAVVTILEENKVNFEVLKRTYWYDVDLRTYEDSGSEENLCKKYFDCGGFTKGQIFACHNKNKPTHIYSCNQQAMNAVVGILDEDDEDTIDFEAATNEEIIEFILGYSEKGFLSACKHCKGIFEGVDTNKIPVARQFAERQGV
jgi:hypothetical protein